MDLVEAGYCVEKPDVVTLAVVLDVRIMRVLRGGVKDDIGFGFLGNKRSVLERNIGRASALHPVIAIVADGDDGMRRVKYLHAPVEYPFEPIRACNAAGRTVLPM